jgi:hypothetical protein
VGRRRASSILARALREGRFAPGGNRDFRLDEDWAESLDGAAQPLPFMDLMIGQWRRHRVASDHRRRDGAVAPERRANLVRATEC